MKIKIKKKQAKTRKKIRVKIKSVSSHAKRTCLMEIENPRRRSVASLRRCI